jgi:altronate hydrolase
LEGLSLGVKCGGSDGFSGVTANPLLGRVAERVAARNGQVLMGEVPEMFGAELGLARRAASRAVLDAFWDLVTRFRADLTRAGALAENPSPGNYAGGISTLAEKSLGCVLKAGRLPVQAVAPYGRRAVADGLTIVECPGNDLVSTTALVAAGANLIAFTTGRGTPMGSLAPTIKISSNPALAARHSDWIDFDGSAVTVCGGAKKRDEAAVDRLLAHILETAGGRPTAAESRDDVQLGIWKRGVTL